MGFELTWMRPDAPYMPIATAGLLSVLDSAGIPARAHWTTVLTISGDVSLNEAAQAVADASVPDPDAVAWPVPEQQAVGSSLRGTGNPLAAYRALLLGADGPARRLLLGLVTDQALDQAGSPRRSPLMRGAKSDLSPFRERLAASSGALTEELSGGPRFGVGKSGRALGLVPEVQTFGGTVGRDASTVNAESRLLSLLLRHGVLGLPPNGVRRGAAWGVGGPLTGQNGVLSWPRWSAPCGLRALRALYAFAPIHELEPDARLLGARGIDAVYRAQPRELSTTVSVFRWGTRVA